MVKSEKCSSTYSVPKPFDKISHLANKISIFSKYACEFW